MRSVSGQAEKHALAHLWTPAENPRRCGKSARLAIANGNISPAEALELVAVIEAQRAVVEKLRPAAMHREPTPKELEEQKTG
jgi:hypothetical protein